MQTLPIINFNDLVKTIFPTALSRKWSCLQILGEQSRPIVASPPAARIRGLFSPTLTLEPLNPCVGDSKA
jgi:hypothetical protein